MINRPIPFLAVLEKMNPEEAIAAKNKAVADLCASDGAQLLAHILRTIEGRALTALRSGLAADSKLHRALGHIEAVEAIRQTLVSLLPEDERTQVDWFDDESEEYSGAWKESN